MGTKARSRSKQHDKVKEDVGRAYWLAAMFMGEEGVQPCYSPVLAEAICEALNAKTCTAVIQFLYGSPQDTPEGALDVIRLGFARHDKKRGGKA